MYRSQQTEMPRTILLFLLSLGFAPAVLAQQVGRSRPPKVQVALVPNVSAVAPGQTFELALKFEIEKGWHIYWKNSGDSGMPPKPRWQLPPGFTASPLRYPVPKRYLDAGGLVTNVLEGTPILLTTVQAPDDLARRAPAEIKLDLQVLTCKESCVMIRRSVQTRLPVVAREAEVKPANQELFAEARASLPKPAQQAKYVKLKPVVNVEKIRPAGRFQFALVVDVRDGFHIQSNKPLEEYFIPTDVFLDVVVGVSFSVPKYPAHHVRALAGGGQVAEFSGQVIIRYEAEADNTLPTDEATIAGILRYQACNARGQCFAPENLEWTLRVPVAEAGASVKRINEQYFSQGSSATGGANPPDHPPDWRPWGSSDDRLAERSLIWYLLAAALGGLILNVMPCVLPVISIKILSFVQQASEQPRRVFHLGLAFASGIVVSFVLLGGLVVLLKQAGQTVGWGFQLSHPPTVIVLAALMFLFGLSLLGVFEINLPGRVTSKLSAAETREGLLGSFLKGVLATILATPCTAPFLGAAIGFAFQQSAGVIMVIMLSVGIGMASPYLLLTANPTWMRYLPRPGPWMERFKQFMGFLLMGTVVWLCNVLLALVEPEEFVWILVLLCFLGATAWLLGLVRPTMSVSRQWGYWGAAAAVGALGAWISFGLDHGSKIPWEPWSAGLAERLSSEGHTVFVDYTAVWCATCQANKKLVLESSDVRNKLKQLGIRPIKAAYDKQPPEMHRELEKYGRAGVPLNIILPAGRPEDVIVLPEQLVGRKQLVLDKLDEAGPSTGQVAVSKQ